MLSTMRTSSTNREMVSSVDGLSSSMEIDNSATEAPKVATALDTSATSTSTQKQDSNENGNLLALEKHHVVLGRYNNGKKVKALTPAVDIYKKVRSQIRRTKYLSTSEVHHIKNTTSLLLQEELASAEAHPVSFWVDVSKAAKAKKLNELKQAHPQLRSCKDFDGEEVVFVRDHNDFFLKADIDTKRRTTANNVKANSHNEDSIKNTSAPFTSSLTATGTSSTSADAQMAVPAETNWKLSTEASVVSTCSTSVSSRATSAAHTASSSASPDQASFDFASDCGSDKPNKEEPSEEAEPTAAPPPTPPADSAAKDFARKPSMGASVISACSLSATVSSLSSNTHPDQANFADTQVPGTKLLFQLEVGSMVDMQVEMDQICGQWICECPDLDVIKRKTSLVETFKSYYMYYQKLLCGNSPLQNSPASELRHLNEALLVQAANKLGNSMIEWFEKFPFSCLPGEANAWVVELRGSMGARGGGGEQADGCSIMQVDSDNGGMEEGSVGTYEGSEEMQAALSDDDRVTLASHYLSEFSLSSDAPHDKAAAEVWHFSGIGEEIEGERICIADWLGGDSGNREAQESQYNQTNSHSHPVVDSKTTPAQTITNHGPRAEWSPVCRDQEHNRAMRDADQAQKERETARAADSRSVTLKRQSPHSLREKIGRLQRFQSNLRNRTSEKKRTRFESRPSRPCAKPSSGHRSGSPDRWDQQQAFPDQSTITNEAQLTILCRRLRHNDPTLKQVRIVGDLACSKALELTQALGPNFYDWDLRPVWDKSANRNEKPSYLVLKQIEPTLWEDSQTSSEEMAIPS